MLEKQRPSWTAGVAGVPGSATRTIRPINHPHPGGEPGTDRSSTLSIRQMPGVNARADVKGIYQSPR